MKKRLIHVLLGTYALLAGGCASWEMRSAPNTPGDPKNASSYGYHPIDPLPVYFTVNNQRYDGEVSSKSILAALPDATMRIAIGQIDTSGSVTFGPAKAGIKGGRYVVILDYTQFDTTWIGVDISDDKGKKLATATTDRKATVTVPVYVGVGLRLTASVSVNEGTVDLGNLFALGAAAQTKQVSGTMVVQSLGISGEAISTIIPMPSDINPSSIQNAILALGTIKAKIYDDGTKVIPRVVGVYNNLGGGQETINGFISSLLEQGVFLEVRKDKSNGRKGGAK